MSFALGPLAFTAPLALLALIGLPLLWFVLRATPPKVPLEGEGRMKASEWRDRSSIRVLSPSIDPPVLGLDGSTATTATR